MRGDVLDREWSAWQAVLEERVRVSIAAERRLAVAVALVSAVLSWFIAHSCAQGLCQ